MNLVTVITSVLFVPWNSAPGSAKAVEKSYKRVI